MKKTAVPAALLLALLLLAGCASAPAAGTEEPELRSYTVTVCFDNGDPAPGVVVNFCTELSCSPVTTDEEGAAVFTGPPDSYHVQIVRLPEGWLPEGESEFTVGPEEQTVRLTLKEAVS